MGRVHVLVSSGERLGLQSRTSMDKSPISSIDTSFFESTFWQHLILIFLLSEADFISKRRLIHFGLTEDEYVVSDVLF